LANILHVSTGAIGNWETGNRTPDWQQLLNIANFFGVTVDQLIREQNGESILNLRPLTAPLSAAAKIPVLGRVPAGIPIEAIEDIIDEIDLSEKLFSDPYEYFALLVSGNSMYPEYMDGDVVIIRKQETADTGDDVVAYINGDDATLKRLIRTERGITLRPLNPEYETRTYSNQDIASIPIRIAGVVVEQRRNRR
jgi:repressor LexA